MITLKKIEWGNFRSYGEDNFLYLDDRTLTQLLGDNGAGKTTIPLLLQEVLYGKNIKGIKKDSLSNRYTDVPGYYITLYFTSSDSKYCIKLVRSKVKLNLVLEENGFDISSHTATATYKTIADIIGIADFKTFCQLTYQSTTDALDFLTATDTQRKRFLISLLDLSQYLVYHEQLKTEIKALNKESSELKGAISTNKAWIARHEKRDLTPMETSEIPEMPVTLVDELASLKLDLTNMSSINVKIATNNKFKEDLAKLASVSDLPECSPEPERLKEEEDTVAVLRSKIRGYGKDIRKLGNVDTSPNCKTCGQAITVQDVSAQLTEAKRERGDCEVSLKSSLETVSHLKKEQKQLDDNDRAVKKFKALLSMIDQGMSSVSLDEKELTKESLSLSKQRVDIQADIDSTTKHNIEASKHNSTINVIRKQLEEFRAEMFVKEQALLELQEETAYLTILKDAFSTNGLVSYKVESSVKVLEVEVNKYLSEFSEFRIRFKLTGEKLNVEVLDDLRNILEIQTVSTGELGRINIATGLAIRKLLSTLTSTRLNFLFLDEIVGVLDAVGKETLFDILQKEDLNTIMVAHEETHPLIPKVEINKTGKISRLNDE